MKRKKIHKKYEHPHDHLRIRRWQRQTQYSLIKLFARCASRANKSLKIVLYHAVSNKKKFHFPPLKNGNKHQGMPMQNIWAIHGKFVVLPTTPQRTVQLLVVLLRKYTVQYADRLQRMHSGVLRRRANGCFATSIVNCLPIFAV